MIRISSSCRFYKYEGEGKDYYYVVIGRQAIILGHRYRSSGTVVITIRAIKPLGTDTSNMVQIATNEMPIELIHAWRGSPLYSQFVGVADDTDVCVKRGARY